MLLVVSPKTLRKINSLVSNSNLLNSSTQVQFQMNDYVLYYYLRESMSSPYYVGYGKPRRVRAKHSRKNGSELCPPRHRRWIVKSGLSKQEAIDLEIKHIRLWGRECDGGVLLNQNLGGEGKPGGQKTKGFSGRKHTEDAKRRISEKVMGKNNPSYGVPCTEERRRKISERAKQRFEQGFKSPTSTTYILTDPNGKNIEVFGSLKKFCMENNLSYATMCAAVKNNRKGPRSNG